MSQTIQYILIAAAVIVLLLIGLKLFKATFKTIFTIVLNAVIGALAIWLLNFIPAVESRSCGGRRCLRVFSAFPRSSSC